MRSPRELVRHLWRRLAAIERRVEAVGQAVAAHDAAATATGHYALGGLQAVSAQISALRREVAAQRSELHEQRLELAAHREQYALDQHRNLSVMQAIADDEAGNRRRLHALRATPEYELAYSEPEPLVSVVIATRDAVEELRERSLPSVLAQTYRHLEVVVVGDSSPPETERAVASFGDPRLRFERISTDDPEPEGDAWHRWLVSGSRPFNHGLRLARGRWITMFADDDVLMPDAVETTLRAAREQRHELCYGVTRAIGPDGVEGLLGAYPPVMGQVGLQGSIIHAGLTFVEHSLTDPLFRIPNDWSLIRRMWRAGARLGFVDQIVCDLYPSRLWRRPLAPADAP